MSAASFLIVKLAAAGDVLLTTALAQALRQARPESRIGWLTSSYAAPLLEGNPDLNDIIRAEAPATGTGARLRAAGQWLPPLRRWRREHPGATVLLAHRSPGLALLLRVAGFRRIVGFDNGCNWGLAAVAPFRLERHRLQLQADLLRAAGVEIAESTTLAPRLHLSRDERAVGERVWRSAPRPRWAIAAGGANNPWSAMPNRRWAPERFLELGRRADAAGVALRWLGGSDDAGTAAWIAARLPERGADPCAGRLSLRHTAAVIAASDLVIGNDSVALVMAQALRRPAVGLYGPTAGARIHAPGQAFVQGWAGCGPCYDPRAGARGQAYRCPRARCMEQITVDEVWREVAHAS